jgi:hypothetical protein
MNMTTSGKIQIALIAVGAAVIGWEVHQSGKQRHELGSVQAASEAQQRELDARATELDELSASNHELQETEARAGNETLRALMRERAAATRNTSEAGSPNRSVGAAMGKVLEDHGLQDVERERLGNKIRADMATFFKMANLPPEKVDQFVAFSVEAEQRKAARFSGLLHGTLSVNDAIRERDNDEIELEKKRREVLGESGYEFLNGIADGMRNEEAKRVLKLIQQNMGPNTLTGDQSDKLQALIKREIVSLNVGNEDLFRPPDELVRQYWQRLEDVLQAASGFLTPNQIETMRTIAAYDLADRQKRVAARRQSLGIN